MRRPRLHAPSGLTARLVVTVVALVVVVSVVIGAVTAVALRASLLDRLDGDVSAALDRAQGGPRGLPFPPPGQFAPGDADGRGEPDDVRGQGVGTLTAFFYDDFQPGVGDVLVDDGDGPAERRELGDDVLDRLSEVPSDGEPHTVDLAGLGSYRVVREDDVAVGLPTGDVSGTVRTLVLVELGLVLAGGLAAAAGGLLLVRRQLRPLREVAGTAHRVAALPLDAGEIGVTERVPERLTDERTEVGQVGAALNTLLAHVETSLDARHASEQRVRQFVADASHELRTPLTTIAGYTELARRRPDDAAAASTALAKVSDESARMTALVEDLLLLARLDSGRPLERRPVDLTRLLLEAVSDARVVAPDHHWRLELPEEAVEVTGDEQRLHQVVTNLLTNARKHTPPGTTVTVTARAGGFSVHDDGPGFPTELVPHAFERFARGDAARERTGGVGLGLALVEAIVTAHGGTVTLTSRPGATRFDVSLGRPVGHV
ncbi:HAMP domain-containing sensor histidine kinase [Nocardioides marinquilinus]|uniref:histidine kinase n=1 Tax=Nocardioides marinquilinus TaxID=1210400 RepID=A0ABP9PG53_9ACTN